MRPGKKPEKDHVQKAGESGETILTNAADTI
jgi:hypothetical protein